MAYWPSEPKASNEDPEYPVITQDVANYFP